MTLAAVETSQTLILLGAAGLVAATFALLVTRRFGLALIVYALYLGLLDGYLKLAVGGDSVTFLRTAMLGAIVGAALLGMVVDRRKVVTPPLAILVFGVVVIGLVQIANPGNPNLIKPIGSLRQDIEFVPLFFFAYALVRRDGDLQTLLLLLVGVAAANGIANLIQFNLSADQFANWGPGYRQRIFGGDGVAGKIFTDGSGTGRVRPFGLGGDAGGGGTFGVLAAPAVVALILRPMATKYLSASAVRLAAVAALPAIVLAIVLSQTRAIVIATVFALLVYAVLTARRQLLPLVIAASVTVALSLVIIGQLTEGTGAAKLSRYGNITPAKVFSTTRDERGGSLEVGATYAAKFPFGAGVGGVGPATGFNGTVRPEEGLNGETQFNVFILDLGVPGLILILALAGAVVVRFRRIPGILDVGRQARLAALAGGFGGVLIQFVSASPLTGPPAAPFFWAVAGIAVRWLTVNRPRRPVRAGSTAPGVQALPPAPQRASPAARPMAPAGG